MDVLVVPAFCPDTVYSGSVSPNDAREEVMKV